MNHDIQSQILISYKAVKGMYDPDLRVQQFIRFPFR
jgi:hypothetical protein